MVSPNTPHCLSVLNLLCLLSAHICKSILYREFSAYAIIIARVRPKDERALVSKLWCHQSCYSFDIFEVQCNSSLLFKSKNPHNAGTF